MRVSVCRALGAGLAGGLGLLVPPVALGDVTGIAYSTVTAKGFEVVATVSQGESGTPMRFVASLVPGQSVILCAAIRRPGRIENGDRPGRRHHPGLGAEFYRRCDELSRPPKRTAEPGVL